MTKMREFLNAIETAERKKTDDNYTVMARMLGACEAFLIILESEIDPDALAHFYKTHNPEKAK